MVDGQRRTKAVGDNVPIRVAEIAKRQAGKVEILPGGRPEGLAVTVIGTGDVISSVTV
ncbi:hypothetical protein KPB2_5359 [Klebsiella pneumoniae Kb677]|nr:hypothetical protein KPB2_5359 [Klebsiella pneumoniae Kb677]